MRIRAYMALRRAKAVGRLACNARVAPYARQIHLCLRKLTLQTDEADTKRSDAWPLFIGVNQCCFASMCQGIKIILGREIKGSAAVDAIFNRYYKSFIRAFAQAREAYGDYERDPEEDMPSDWPWRRLREGRRVRDEGPVQEPARSLMHVMRRSTRSSNMLSAVRAAACRIRRIILGTLQYIQRTRRWRPSARRASCSPIE